MLSIIVALDSNNLIGAANKLPWHLPADLKHFKNTTIGKTVIMGRKTFDSMGKPLRERRNIVITRNKNFVATGCEVVSSLDEAIKLCQNEKEVFLIGGAEIIKHALPLCNKLYLTRIYHEFEGDTFLNDLDLSKWRLVDEQDHEADDKNKWSFSFYTYVPK